MSSTNSLLGINLAQIAEESLLALEPRMFLLSAFMTDFSNDVKAAGESVATRVPNTMTAIDVSNGYTATNVGSVAKTVTLNKEYGFPMAFRDSEVSKAGDINWLRSVFITPAVNSVLRQMVSDALALVTVATFSQNTVIAAANFSYSNVVGIDVLLEAANAGTERSLLISPTYAGTLRKDTYVAAYIGNGAGNEQLVRYGNLGPIAGFNTFTYTAIPTTNNLAGIACAKQAILMAARQPAVDPTMEGEVVNVQEPTTGLPLQFRKFYVHKEKRTYITCEAFYGVAAGVTGNLYRILSAAE